MTGGVDLRLGLGLGAPLKLGDRPLIEGARAVGATLVIVLVTVNLKPDHRLLSVYGGHFRGGAGYEPNQGPMLVVEVGRFYGQLDRDGARLGSLVVGRIRCPGATARDGNGVRPADGCILLHVGSIVGRLVSL